MKIPVFLYKKIMNNFTVTRDAPGGCTLKLCVEYAIIPNDKSKYNYLLTNDDKVSFFKIKKHLTFYFLSDIIIKITNFCGKRELLEKH